MKRFSILLGLSCVSSLFAQTEFPGNPTVSPKKTETRSTGGSSSASGTTNHQMVRYVTHVVLSESRTWTSSDGKPLEAKLIAFEDLTVEAPQGSAAPQMPTPPAHPTVIKGEKVRLLVGQKPVELAIARLSQPDQEFVAQIKASLAKKAAATPSQGG